MASRILKLICAEMGRAGPANAEKRELALILASAAAALVLLANLVFLLRPDPAGPALLPEPCAQGTLRGFLGCLAPASSPASFGSSSRPGAGQNEHSVAEPCRAGRTGGSPHDASHNGVQAPVQEQRRKEVQQVKGKEASRLEAMTAKGSKEHELELVQGLVQKMEQEYGDDGKTNAQKRGPKPKGREAVDSRKQSYGSSGSRRSHNSKANQQRLSPEAPASLAQSEANSQEQGKRPAIDRSEDLLTSALAIPGHAEDLEKVAELATIMRPLARNNTVVVIPTNAAYLDMALNVRCRLLDLNATNFMIWALDDDAVAGLQSRNISNLYYDRTLFSVKNLTGYYDADYIRMMSERPKVWWRMLATGLDIAFLDADVVVFDPPDAMFARKGDVEGQVDGWGWVFERNFSNVPALCAGTFWMRSSLASLHFMDRVIHTFDERLKHGKKERWDDQLALNWILHDASQVVIANRGKHDDGEAGKKLEENKLTMYFSDPTKILPGHLWWGTHLAGEGYNTTISIQFNPNEPPLSFRPSLFHLSGHGEKSKKLNTLKGHGWWELDANLKCRSATSHDA